MDIWGYCYLIMFDQSSGAYKIGYGKSADKRLKQFQRTNIQRLYMIATCYCYHPRLLEKLLHQKYGTSRLRRSSEFFYLSDEQVREICEMFKRLENTHIYREAVTN